MCFGNIIYEINIDRAISARVFDILSEINNFDKMCSSKFIKTTFERLNMSNKIDGALDISTGVFADIVGYAALECYGVVGVADANKVDAFLSLLPTWRLRRGVNVVADGENVDVEVFVVVEYGTSISTVCENLRERIEFVLKEFAGVKNVNVKVNVCDVNVRES